MFLHMYDIYIAFIAGIFVLEQFKLHQCVESYRCFFVMFMDRRTVRMGLPHYFGFFPAKKNRQPRKQYVFN